MNQARLAQLIAENGELSAKNAQLSEQLRRLEDGPMRLQDLSTSAVHQVARFYAAAEATIHDHRATIDGPRTLIKVNGKSAQVLGRRRNGAWQVDRDPPFDENAEVVIFVDLGCAPAWVLHRPGPRPATALRYPCTLDRTAPRHAVESRDPRRGDRTRVQQLLSLLNHVMS